MMTGGEEVRYQPRREKKKSLAAPRRASRRKRVKGKSQAHTACRNPRRDQLGRRPRCKTAPPHEKKRQKPKGPNLRKKGGKETSRTTK